VRPGNWFSFFNDEEFLPGLVELQAWMRQIRGTFLSESFGLENDLILLTLANEFGDVSASGPTPQHVGRDLELRDLELSKKIRLIFPVVRRLRLQADSDRLIQKLGDCRELRNVMAHFPCWTEPVNDEAKNRTVGLKLFIGDKHHVWKVEESDVTEWTGLFLDVRRQLILLRHDLLGLPRPIFGKGSIVAVGTETQGSLTR
jgi:hypothetical protein